MYMTAFMFSPQTIGKQMATKQFLETKVAELEKVREASDQKMDDQLVFIHAIL